MPTRITDPTVLAIEECIAALPLRDGANARFELTRARNIIVDAVRLEVVGAQPGFRQTPRAKTIKQLDKLQKLSSKLAEHTASLGADALKAIERVDFDAVPGQWLHDRLRQIETATSKIDRVALPDDVKYKRGNPTNFVARAVALSGSVAFESYTGRKPTITTSPTTSKRSGKFIEFIKALFSALGIEGSAADYAEQAQEDRLRGLIGPKITN